MNLRRISYGTSIEIRNVGTAAARSVTTDAAGRYAVPDLVPGNYEVTASKTGFTTSLQKGIVLAVGG